ncbi:MAG: hypothetical protein CL840_06385 [Crocinitomicaceae bacterium]|nr:hypothetical protein [Crocinitomicaceae bacterium]|tara:strand:- start:20016 stop:21371 length:1356 start_codon:yes stop_codon:yes gene_type:complete
MREIEKIEPDRFRLLLETEQEISNFNITKEVIIDNSYVIGNNSVTISNCIFDFEFQLKDNQYNQNYFFINCTFNQRFLTANLHMQNLQLLRCTFHQYFTSKNLNTELLSFEYCQFNLQKEQIINQFRANKLRFIRNEFNKDVQLIPREVDLISLSGGESNSALIVSNRGNKNITNSVFLEFNSNFKTDFLLRNLRVKYFQIHGELKDATLSLNNITLQTGILKYFSNNGNVLINSLIPESNSSILVLKGVNLGQALISSTSFTKFSKIQVSNSNLVDIVPVNIEWCQSESLKSSNSLDERKETYRQLKQVASKNSDTSTKLLYHKYEMRAYLKILKKQKGKFIDKFILHTNQISNSHGLNWGVAFCWLFGFSVLWYTLVKYSIGHTNFSPELIGNEIGRFINFINPAHHFDKVFNVEKSYSGNALLFDGLSRITGAYLIYQFVSAFRKYSK